MALLDEIRQRLQNTKAPDITGTQKQLSSVLQAKTGKAGAAQTGPQASTMGEQAVQTDLAQQAQQQQLQGAMVAEQLKQQQQFQQEQTAFAQDKMAAQRQMAEAGMAQQAALAREGLGTQMSIQRAQLSANEQMKTDAINSQYKNNIAALASNKKIAEDDIFSQYRQSNQELEFRQDAAEIEQLGFQLALSDKQYIDEIVATGKMRELENEVNFKKAFLDTQLKNNTKALVEKIGWMKDFDADDRQFEMSMANMSIDDAIALLDAQLKDANIASMINAGGKIASTIVMSGGSDEEELSGTKPDYSKSTSMNVGSGTGGAPMSVTPGSSSAPTMSTNSFKEGVLFQ